MRGLQVLAAETYVSPRERQLTERESRVRSIAYALKTPGSGAEHEAALVMARLVPAGAALVPIPSSSGSLDANASLAQALAQLTDGVLVPALQRTVPVEASHARRHRGERGLTPEAHTASFFLSAPLPYGRPVVLVDNVVTTGATLEGAWRAMGSPPGAIGVAYARANEVTNVQQNPPAWLGKLASWTAVGAVSDMLLGPIQRAVAGGTERAVVAMNPDVDLRALERRARASGDLNDALALYRAERLAGSVAQAPWIAIEHVKGVTDEIARRMDGLGLTRTHSAHPAFGDRSPEHAYVSMTAEGRDGRDEDGAIEVEVRLFLLSGVWTARCTTFTNSFRRVTGVTALHDADQTGALRWANQAVRRWASSRRRRQRRPPGANPIRARFGSDRDPVDVYGPAFPGSTTYWDAKFVDGGERGYLGATDLYDAKGRRWLDPKAPPARPAWTNPPMRCRKNCPACLAVVAVGAYGVLRGRR